METSIRREAKLEIAPMVELRKQRDAKLAETDFYALSDVTGRQYENISSTTS